MVKPIVTEGKRLSVTSFLPPLLCVLRSLSRPPAHGTHRHSWICSLPLNLVTPRSLTGCGNFRCACAHTHKPCPRQPSVCQQKDSSTYLSKTNTRNTVQREQKVGCTQQECDSIMVIFSFSIEGSRSTLKSYFLTRGFLS